MSNGGSARVLWQVWRKAGLLLTVLAAFGGFALAQDAASADDEPQYTLHAYANLVQIPVLVLTPDRDRLPRPIDRDRFEVSIDSGPWFRARHVRLEGDDPISLSILLDDRAEARPMLGAADEAFASLAPESLRPADHVSIYALDCGLVRSLNDVPATADSLRMGVKAALHGAEERRSSHARCVKRVELQAALEYLSASAANRPGRRVVLAITDGEEEVAKPSWHEVAVAAQNTATTIFAVMPHLGVVPEISGPLTQMQRGEISLSTACELSGGAAIRGGEKKLGTELSDVMRMVRERYVVDFPRPSNSTPGQHSLEVRVRGMQAFIRAAGVTIPIPDPEALADPNTVPSDPSLAPVQGNRSKLPH